MPFIHVITVRHLQWLTSSNCIWLSMGISDVLNDTSFLDSNMNSWVLVMTLGLPFLLLLFCIFCISNHVLYWWSMVPSDNSHVNLMDIRESQRDWNEVTASIHWDGKIYIDLNVGIFRIIMMIKGPICLSLQLKDSFI